VVVLLNVMKILIVLAQKINAWAAISTIIQTLEFVCQIVLAM
jgi:hypothetical protein